MMNVLTHKLKFVSLATLLFTMGVCTSSSAQEPINWQSFEDAIAIAEENNQPILVDIWAPWCGWCHKMKKETYPQLPNNLARKFVFTRLNRDDHQAEHSYKGQTLSSLKLSQKLNAQSVPTVVILSSDGHYLFHISGFVSTKELERVLLKIKQFTSRR